MLISVINFHTIIYSDSKKFHYYLKLKYLNFKYFLNFDQLFHYIFLCFIFKFNNKYYPPMYLILGLMNIMGAEIYTGYFFLNEILLCSRIYCCFFY